MWGRERGAGVDGSGVLPIGHQFHGFQFRRQNWLVSHVHCGQHKFAFFFVCASEKRKRANAGVNIAELERQEADLKSSHERQVEELQRELDSCVAMVADAFDKYVRSSVSCRQPIESLDVAL